MSVPANLCLAFSVDNSKISAVAYEDQLSGPTQEDPTLKGTRIHGFSQLECSLFSGPGLKSIRLATDAIIELTEELERQASCQFIEACLTFSSKTLRIGGKSAIVNIGGKKVSQADIDSLQKLIRTPASPNSDWVPFFRCLSPFRLDRETISSEPIGLAHNTLAQTQVSFSEKKTTLANILEVFRNSGLNIKRIFPQPVAAAFASTYAHERQHGIAVVDIGLNLVQIICYKDSLPRFCTILNRGSGLITQDLSVCLQIDLKEAESLKRNMVCFQSNVSGSDLVKFGHLATEVATARAGETVKIVKRVLETNLTPSDYKSGVVLVGQGSKLKGLLSQFKAQIHPLCRISNEFGLAGLSEGLDDAGLAPLAGIAKMDSTSSNQNEFIVPNLELQRKNKSSFFNIFRMLSP